MQPTSNFEMSFESTYEELVRTDYRIETVRMQSYKNWTNRTLRKGYIEVLADAGFYYTGESDKMKCFDCHIVISNWNEYIDPLIKHAELSPKCRFVRMIDSCGNVPFHVDIDAAPPRVPQMDEILKLNPLGLNLDKVVEVYFQNVDAVKRVRLGDLMGAVNPTFAYYEIRLQSYKLWPEWLTQKKEDMALAGFICKNDADKVECFYCGGVLKNWQPFEPPLFSHAQRFPNCSFIRKLL